MAGGFAVAGNMIVDITKRIAAFPKRHELVTILEKSYSTGGLAPNVIGTLSRLDPTLPLKAVGLVGKDQEGDMIIESMSQFKNVDISLIGREGYSAFTDVLTEDDSLARTFLTYLGANAKFDISHVPVDELDCDIFHCGYILLLPMLDVMDEVYGTRMARLLHDVKARGILTSVDVVSEVGARFGKLVPPALKYADYFIVNEIEAGNTAGINLRDEHDRLLIEKVPGVLHILKKMGVARWAVIHSPEGGFGLDELGNYAELPSLELPKGFIKGTVGAGDAFCAGCLYAAWRGLGILDGLKYGIAAAATSLSEPGGSDGVKPIGEALRLYDDMPKQTLSLKPHI